MISMKVQKKESKQSGNPARSLILVQCVPVRRLRCSRRQNRQILMEKTKYMQLLKIGRKLFPLMLTKQMYCQQELQE